MGVGDTTEGCCASVRSRGATIQGVALMELYHVLSGGPGNKMRPRAQHTGVICNAATVLLFVFFPSAYYVSNYAALCQ